VGAAVPRAAGRVRIGADAEKECSAPQAIVGRARLVASRDAAAANSSATSRFASLRVVADFGQRRRGRSNHDARVGGQARAAPAPTVGADSDPAVRWAAC
jgi:hypothetical protein